jgi:hypothetical protein
MRANKRFLYVVGCSWSAKGGNPYHGYEGESREEKIESEDKLKWQRILSDKLNLELINDAVVGGSNDMSIRKLRNFILHDERSLNSIIIWQWTELSRYMIFSRQDNVFCHINTFENKVRREIEKRKKRIDKYTYSDIIKVYDLIDETAWISNLCKIRDIGFVVFDGIANVKPILDARIKLLKAEEDLKKSNNFEPSYRNDEFYSPIVIDGTYHNIKVLLYEHLIQKKIIIKPHGYFSWQEALKKHPSLDREKIDGAYVGKKFSEDLDVKTSKRDFDYHPGNDAAILFSTDLYYWIKKNIEGIT